MKLLNPLFVLRRGKKKSVRSVSTWSPLATAFNTRPTSTKPPYENIKGNTGLFNIPELATFEGFHILKDQAISATDRLIEEATSNPTRPMVDIFDELSDTLCKVADLAEFVRIAHPQSHYASAAEEACISVSGVVEKLNTHRGLYDALNNSVKSGTSGDEHLAKLFLFDFEQSGIHLDEEPRDKVVALNDVILQTGQRFMAGASRPRKVQRKSLPPAVRQYFSVDGDHVIVNGVYAECPDAAAREAAYKLYLSPDPLQDRLLNATLDARKDMASVTGFSCYADRAIKSSTMETSGNVRRFLDLLSEKLRDRARNDFIAMLDMKQKGLPSINPFSTSLNCWDTPFFTHKAKSELLKVNNSDFSPYFSLGGCMEGLNMLCQELFGISLVSEPMIPGESWSPDVYKLAVMHESEGLLGHIYCDLYERAGKPHQDCHFTIRGGKLLPDGTYQNPIVVVMLSLSGGHRGGPALLGAGSVDNLFHEVGHALHSMLGRARHQHVAGTRCATDLAEVPSVLHEYFASSHKVLSRFAKHFQTGQPMPEDMLHRLCASKYLFGASEMQLQIEGGLDGLMPSSAWLSSSFMAPALAGGALHRTANCIVAPKLVFYSALDQHYHSEKASHDGETTAVLRKVQKQYYGLPYVENTAWQHRFSHLIGYGAKYYSYLISRGVAWSAWKKDFEKNPLSRKAGQRLREGLLSHGGATPPKTLLRSYLGEAVTPQSLANALADELDYHKDHLDRVLTIAAKK